MERITERNHFFSDDMGRVESASTRRRRNLLHIFNNTSLIPFKWRGKFICYFCEERFKDSKLLRKHSKSHPPVKLKDKALHSQRKCNIEVKLDVSEITCEICNESFNTLDEIVQHLTFKHNLEYDKSVESPIEPYRLIDLKCLVCGFAGRNFINLVTHMNNSHPHNSHPCEHCGQMFNKLRDLDTHKRNFHKEGGYPCEICNKNFPTNQRLRVHTNKAHLSSCEICCKQFSTIEIKNRHFISAHADIFKGIKSEYPRYDMIDEGDLLEMNHQDLNQRKEKGARNRANISVILNMSTAIPFKYFKNQYLCFYCSKYFTDCELMKEHIVSSHVAYNTKQKVTKALKGSDVCIKIDISNLTCKVCFESFDGLESLIDHLIVKHNAPYDKNVTGIMQPFKLKRDNMACPVCNADNFSYFGTLLRHMNKNHASHNFICDNCGEAFGSTLLLKAHMNRLHSDKEYKCEICGIVFNQSLKLETHKAKTHGVKSVVCPKCPEAFLSDYAKRKHLMRVHNVGHKCTYCDRMFTKNSFMRSHIKRTHLKEKNVVCPYCNVKFFDNYILRQHIVKHIGDKNFHCDVCGKSFFWKKNLRGHMASHSKHTQNLDVQF
ncbi:zinc finger protein 728-like [Plutella xylostella]|uniref:zinc finger protein 728-like n=1 Tax=Plutella xylostella TaxID=51655 RepID=UPI0020324DA9|nr:zinc finger protein 728-like [Plutella xylostella]